MKGYIHSAESFGTVDGPGIRYVLFMQGCPMRCLYCHNPDTWKIGGGKEIDAETVISEYNKNKMFYRGGGITVTGGEPLLQIDFLTELFKLAKSEGIHTCIDTSGIVYNSASSDLTEKLDELMRYTDLVMLDIKHIDTDKHKSLTAHGNERILDFARYLAKRRIPLWIRHVIVEGYTDDPEDLRALGRFIGGLDNLQALDVLPYHAMGEAKYRELGMDYPLAGLPALAKEKAIAAKGHIIEGIKEARKVK
jgi:pyruvate formate lyase activating enzyme